MRSETSAVAIAAAAAPVLLESLIETRDASSLRLGRQSRLARMVRETANREAREVDLAFSSEEPVERWFGTEILGHAPGECDLTWLTSGRAPLLSEHSARQQIGVVVSAEIGGDRTGRARVRFGKSALADQEFNDVLDGVRMNVSVGYEISELNLVKDENGVKTYRARWRPFEVSLVSIPADMTVGVGRAETETNPRDVPVIRTQTQQETDDMLTRNAGGQPAPSPAPVPPAPPAPIVDNRAQPAPAAPVVQPTGHTADALAAERARITQINELAGRHQRRDLGDVAIAQGLTIEQFRGMVAAVIPQGTQLYTPQAEIGMSRNEVRQYSLARALLAAASPGNAALQQAAALEIEASRSVAERVGRAPNGFFVPMDVQAVAVDVRAAELQRVLEHLGRVIAAQRDLTVGTPTAGGNLVGTNLLAGSFIDLLRNRMLLSTMGATLLPGLVGNVAIPKLTAAATGAWVAENSAAAESQQTFGQLTMAPKTVSAWTDFSRQLLLQSTPAVDQIVRGDLAAVLALMIDLAGLHGTGASNQPTGIAATAGIGSVAGGTNGLAPTWAHVVALETAVAVANADVGAVGYLTNPKVRGTLKTTEKATGTAQFVWGDNQSQPGMGMVNGYRAGVTNQVSSTLTKGSSSGVCSAIFYGNWNDLIIGEWGVLDILVDPYSGGTAGTVRTIAFQTVDVGVRRAASFAAMLDALTP